MRWKWVVLLLSVGCGMVGLSLQAKGASPRRPVAAETGAAAQLIQELQASGCRTKFQAVVRYLRTPGDRLQALQQEAAGATEAVRVWTDAIIARLVEEDSLGRRFEEEWPRRFVQAHRIQDPAARATALEAAAEGLHAIVVDPQESFMLRLAAAGALAYFAARIDRENNPPWVQKIPGLLDSPDARSRLVGALVAAGGQLRQEQAPEKGRVIPELIGGLRGETFAERDYAYNALVELTALATEQFCVDPTAPPEVRAKAIEAWERWWAAHKDALAQERIPQHW